MTDITEDDLLKAALKALSSAPPPGLEEGTTTAPILADELEISSGKARRVLKKMHQDGTVIPDMVRYVDPWGYRQKIKGWRLIV